MSWCVWSWEGWSIGMAHNMINKRHWDKLHIVGYSGSTQKGTDDQGQAGGGGGDCIYRADDRYHCHRLRTAKAPSNYGAPCKEVMKAGECEYKTTEAKEE